MSKGGKRKEGCKAQRKSMIHNVMIIIFNQRMIEAYTEELMIKLATLLKIAWVMEFDKVKFSI